MVREGLPVTAAPNSNASKRIMVIQPHTKYLTAWGGGRDTDSEGSYKSIRKAQLLVSSLEFVTPVHTPRKRVNKQSQ